MSDLICEVEGCEREVRSLRLCARHHYRLKKHGSPTGGGPDRTKISRLPNCSVDECERESYARNLCAKHYQAMLRHGDPLVSLRPRGETHYAWKGGRTIGPDGYMKIQVPGTSEYVLEHRYVMEQHLGRPLLPAETVHHKNGVRDENRLENLELWSSSHPRGQRVEDKLEWAREIIALYGEDDRPALRAA